MHYKLRFKRPFQALLLKNTGKCKNNASFYPVFHRGAAEGMWLARRAMDLKRLKTPGLRGRTNFLFKELSDVAL
jgi:hypothetical protein